MRRWPAWQTATELYNRVLNFFEEPNVPLTAAFRNQMERAALSVSNNIAEGIERSTTQELFRFGDWAWIGWGGEVDGGGGEEAA